ncbi:PadR family transcriptional regulator [Niameybacter massiliensis]|uniref:PadR family transcriptional regulator n=1 Tax=Holtiella tumoricola TaxID=3018743 RepID=A0AA42DK11_9FIRM|nr:PadR family transcriptional regulator [Holtiella tumoricola]
MAIPLSGSLLDACVLAVVRKGDVYGYRLTQEVREALEISESTLYPVLRRLQKEGCLCTYDEPYQGRNRRYYQITELGHAKYDAFLEEWTMYKDKVDRVLMGGNNNE